jgi:hypothetical protein
MNMDDKDLEKSVHYKVLEDGRCSFEEAIDNFYRGIYASIVSEGEGGLFCGL